MQQPIPKGTHQVIKVWADTISDYSKLIPDFLYYPHYYQIFRIKKEIPVYLDNCKKTKKQIKLFSCFLAKDNSLPSSFRNYWGRISRAIFKKLQVLIYFFKEVDWIPDKSAAELTTPKLEDLKFLLNDTRKSMSTLFFSLAIESRNLEIEERRVKLKPKEPPKPILGKQKKKTTFKMNEWTQQFLLSLITKEGDENKKITKEELTEIENFDSEKFEVQNSHPLLPDGVEWGVINYTVALNTCLNKNSVKVLADAPYCFDPEYIGGTSHIALGLKRLHIQGFWYLRNGKVLGTEKSIKTYEEVTRFVDKLKKKIGIDYFSNLTIYQNPVYREGHYYWLLLPKNISITIETWGLI